MEIESDIMCRLSIIINMQSYYQLDVFLIDYIHLIHGCFNFNLGIFGWFLVHIVNNKG